ncbi:hypothetical protein HELRODRAFT_193283 [Helobdella robusta]|uniref:RING-type domain-containing protein n=1 Tax=Helobdella robusta TaxID=6412 RepID=T1FUU0_HELRO|nr:hypothetical protein HELRODRAFT_193283 [Helobdella robusta]ESN97156.1 hypothetical protein HELRODRAFT_193283 [Helobdella robusta]
MFSKSCDNCKQPKVTKLLPCQHCYYCCFLCLVTTEGKIDCPVCLASHDRSLILNLDPHHNMEVSARKEVAEEKPAKLHSCEICANKPVDACCVDCGRIFCSGCIEFHNNVESNKTHVIIQVETALGEDFLAKYNELLSKVELEAENIKSEISQYETLREKSQEILESFQVDEDSEKSEILSTIQTKGDTAKNKINCHVAEEIIKVEKYFENIKNERLNYQGTAKNLIKDLESQIDSLKETLETLDVNTITDYQPPVFSKPNCPYYKPKNGKRLMSPSPHSSLTVPETFDQAVENVNNYIGVFDFHGSTMKKSKSS